MSDLIRTDTVFGKRTNIVGNISADLVLESLGKVYIKSRNKAQTLEELITSLVLEDPNVSTSRVLVVDGIENLDTSSFKEGTFVFDKLSNILYLFIDGELLELINVAPEGTGYVKRSGDTMTGRLAIYVKNGPPLYVNSSTLVPNLNAQYLNGETAENFTRRNRDEVINGKWTFNAITKFKSNIGVEKDIVLNGSIGSPSFASGFGGYGWRMDADTNTLTVDNLVVRKLMKVYELVVNKISATNGSLWVSNAGKVISATKLIVKPHSFFATATEERNEFCAGLKTNEVFVKEPVGPENNKITLDDSAFDTASGEGIFNKTTQDNNNCYTAEFLKGMELVRASVDSPSGELVPIGEGAQSVTILNPNQYNTTSLFDSDFKFNCTFPIINRNNKQLFDLASNPNPRDYVSLIKSYYKYFAGGDYYYVSFDDDSLPVFKIGDILRCQKWTYGGIKYYDAVVCKRVGSSYIIQVADSILDKKTTIEYDSSLNPTYTIEEDDYNLDLYKTSGEFSEPEESNDGFNEEGLHTTYDYDAELKRKILGIVEEKDSLVQIGNLWDKQRQHAVYITSTDDAAPYMDVLSGINRPDYTVNYHVPVYQTVKLHMASQNSIIGYTNLADIPYTGDYYIQDSTISNFNYEYVYFQYEESLYLGTKGGILPNGATVKYYLNTIPDEYTQLGEPTENYYILLEDGGKILLEDEGALIQEEQKLNLRIESTKTTRSRLGNLDGIVDEVFPIDKQPYGYGLYGQNVFLTGEFYLSNGQAVADIGKDAMMFAIAAAQSGNLAINLLREDMNRADTLLKNSHYSKGTLKTAGMYIGNDANNQPGIVIWGNKILFATTDLEFSGYVQPTMLLQNGKIQGKYLCVDEASSTINATVAQSQFTIDNIQYASSGPIRVFRQKNQRTASNGTKYYVDDDTTYYIRKFVLNEGTSKWLLVNPDGYPTEKDIYGNYTSVAYPTITYYTDSGEAISITDGVISSEYEQGFIDNYTTPLKVWALQKDGKGNLGGSTLYWDKLGKVVVSGILYSNEGNIGGLYLGNDSLYTLHYTFNQTNEKVPFNPIILSTAGYGYDANETKCPYMTFASLDINYSIQHKTTITSSGVFYIGNTDNTSTDWKDLIVAQVPSTLFTLTIIPVYSTQTETWTLYSRLSSCYGLFNYVDTTWGKGFYAINFPLITDVAQNTAGVWLQQTEWFIKKLKLGQIHFIVSGCNDGICSYDYSQMGFYIFNPDIMSENNSIGFQMGFDKLVKANIECMEFKGINSSFSMGNSGTDYSRAFTYACKIKRNQDGSTSGRPDEGGLYGWGYANNYFGSNSFRNYIVIATGDDSSANWGGFTLTALYLPTLDDRFITDTNTLTPGYDPAAQQQINQEEEDREALIITIKEQYGTGGIKYNELINALNTKKSTMTTDQLEAQTSTISSIESSIANMAAAADHVSVTATLTQLENLQNILSNNYNSILSSINNLEVGNTAYTILNVEPTATSVDEKLHTNITPSNKASASGENNKYIGYIDPDVSTYGTPTVYGIYLLDGANMIEDGSVQFTPDGNGYKIYANILPNQTTSIKHSKLWIQFASVNEIGFIHMYQAANQYLSWSASQFVYNGNNLASKPTLTIPNGITVTYSSSNTGVATIDSNGNITVISGVTSGSTTITATGSDGSSDSYTFIISISLLDTYLTEFNSRAFSEENIVPGTDLYNFLSTSLTTMINISDSISISTISNGPIVSLGSSYNTDSRNGMFLGMLLTTLFPFNGTSAISDSDVSSRRNNKPLKVAFDTWGVNRASVLNNVSTYTEVYAGQLLASICFAKMMADSNYRTSMTTLKSYSYTSRYLQYYTFCDADEFTLTNIAPKGSEIFPYPLSNTNSPSTTTLEGRDENAYRQGKEARKFDGTYDSTDGGIANNDSSHVNNYPDNNTNRIGYFLDIYGTATNNRITISVPSSAPHTSYVNNGEEYGSTKGFETLSYSYINYSKYCLLDLAYKPGRDTVNNIKASDSSSPWYRDRPFYYHSDDSPLVYQNGDSDTGNLNKTSYPSGHSGYAWGMALAYTTLGNFTDSELNSLFARAYKFCQGRVIVGAHWQFDVEMGRLAAACNFAMMCGNRLFIEQLNRANP